MDNTLEKCCHCKIFDDAIRKNNFCLCAYEWYVENVIDKPAIIKDCIKYIPIEEGEN